MKPQSVGIPLLDDLHHRYMAFRWSREHLRRWKSVPLEPGTDLRLTGSASEVKRRLKLQAHVTDTMSLRMSASTRAPRMPVDFRRQGGGDRASLSWQVAVIGDMLATLETLTTAGQHHLMGKVVAVVRDQVLRAATLVSRPDRATLARLVEDLERESDRRSPDLSVFTPRAERLIKILAVVR